MKHVLLPLMLVCFATANAQTVKKCYSKEFIDFQSQNTPGYKEHVDQQFGLAKQWSESNAPTRAIYTIPVVFHVVYNTPEENIPDSVILNQLAVLNADYARQNEDTSNMRSEFMPVAGATNVRFALAALDPSGNPTTGITRTSTATASFGSIGILTGDMSDLEKVKSTANGGIDAWNQARYLNVWICDMSLFGSPFLLGYATPPDNLPNWPAGSNGGMGDGVVLQFQAVGSNNPNVLIAGYDVMGRTASHEIGHYLGLRHIWGDGDDCTAEDGIDDTPHATEASQQDCNTSKNTCVDVMPEGDLHDMIENFMDYSAETCQNSFTNGQAALMHGVLENQRYDLVHNNPALELAELAVNFSCYPNPARENLTIKTNNLVSKVIVLDMNGQVLLSQNGAGNGATINVNGISSGIYLLQVVYSNGKTGQQRFTITQ